MGPPANRASTVTRAWELARSGDLRGGAEAAQAALAKWGPRASVASRVELRLVAAFCAMRQGHHADALGELEAAGCTASSRPGEPGSALRVAVHFDRATSQLSEPHARAHLSSLDPGVIAPMEVEARRALALFERARAVAKRARYEFAAWYVAGNIERLEILLGNSAGAVRAITKRLAVLQKRGAKYDEIVTRSNLAWGLRTLGRYREALHELDVALDLARETGTFNVLLEFLEYDRSIVLDALGDTTAARASYRRYLQLVGAWNRNAAVAQNDVRAAKPKRPLEPYFLKRADRFALEHLGETFAIPELARHCGVSWRTLEKAFRDFRGVTPVAHIRNLRLDQAHKALGDGGSAVAQIAARYGFASPTTFTLEYRKRYGIAPSHAKGAARTASLSER